MYCSDIIIIVEACLTKGNCNMSLISEKIIKITKQPISSRKVRMIFLLSLDHLFDLISLCAVGIVVGSYSLVSKRSRFWRSRAGPAALGYGLWPHNGIHGPGLHQNLSQTLGINTYDDKTQRQGVNLCSGTVVVRELIINTCSVSIAVNPFWE